MNVLEKNTFPHEYLLCKWRPMHLHPSCSVTCVHSRQSKVNQCGHDTVNRLVNGNRRRVLRQRLRLQRHEVITRYVFDKDLAPMQISMLTRT